MNSVPITASVRQVDLADIARALGVGKRAVELRAAREKWQFDQVPGIGGMKRYYPLAALPKAIATAVHADLIDTQTSVHLSSNSKDVAMVNSVVTPAISTQDLTTHQLEVERARERILNFVDGFQGTTTAALEFLNHQMEAMMLPGPLRWAYENAWDKRRASNRLSKKTYYNWVAEKKLRGRAAPKKVQRDMSIKPWHALAVALKQRPQGSLMTWIAEQIAEQWNPAWGTDVPSKRAVEYFLKEKFSALDQLKGRHTGSALRVHKSFTPRSSAGMLPWDELHADGWNTHFTAPHPVNGDFVTYEVWHAHDVATRYVPPFGIGLTENFDVIASCIEKAIRFGGVMGILMTDSTAIVKKSERLKTNPATSLADRAGFTIVHPQEVGNSQANGISENFNKYLDRCSRELATYQAKDMDSMTLRRVKKLTAKMVNAGAAGQLVERERIRRECEAAGKGRVFDSHQEAVNWLEEKRVQFNARPHSSLPKVRDPHTGRKRHQSPAEALQAHRDAGWEGFMVDEFHLVDMFWHHVQKKVTRCSVTPYKKMVYHDEALADWNGKDVVVAYDENVDARVWVKTLGGEIICEAKFVSASGYRMQTAKEAADEKRALKQIERSLKKIDTIRARTPGMVIENTGGLVEDAPRLKNITDFVDAVPHQVSEPARTIADFLPAPAAAEKPTMTRDEVVMWLHGKPEEEEVEPGNKKAAV